MLAIKAVNLTKVYGERKAVDKVNLSIKEGEIYGFLGPNGAGKSTTIKMLVTLILPTSGDAQIVGKSVIEQADDVRLEIGVALQEAALDMSQNGIDFLRLQAHLYGLRGSAVESRLAELIKIVDIGDAIYKPIKSYSGGMKRRLDLAAALVHNPKILFLDEPTTGLDPTSRVKVWEEVRRLNKDLGITIFLTTQYLEEADQLADRIGIIDGGKLVVEGTPSELKKKVGKDLIVIRANKMTNKALESLRKLQGITKVEAHGSEITLSTLQGSAVISSVAIEMERLKIPIQQLTLRETTLDDVFLEYTGNRLDDKEKNK